MTPDPKKVEEIVCPHCEGKGYQWRTPNGFNPFSAGGWNTIRAMYQDHCYRCDGTGRQIVAQHLKASANG